MEVLGLEHIDLTVNDLAKSAAFYTRVLEALVKRALTSELGEPWKDVDEATISDMQADSYDMELPVQRFTTWVVGKRVVSLLLSGKGESWELLVSGP